ncbi:MAG: hypothetical protein SBU_000569 [Candidatus Syntrophoarchaeum butanivorans]|uniref:Uncharacterized protein n=1 Tax=Candidatus Syntropharchaeum butanivorans TaxID=1839936 RepID=A0A1F2P6I7_9EURY|nr:MAG: hypothetical protein SBU_000569 [Candidatus Syntrophoarchaeum butanivorans]
MVWALEAEKLKDDGIAGSVQVDFSKLSMDEALKILKTSKKRIN